jgi:8-oxo-dGTP pyrophosphatase MutT (NUDIX family)
MNEEKPSVFASGYLIFRRQGTQLQFLLMKHPDRWDLPKGHLDPNESISQAAIRELYEETGIPSDALWTDPKFAFVHSYLVANRKLPYERQLDAAQLTWRKVAEDGTYKVLFAERTLK